VKENLDEWKSTFFVSKLAKNQNDDRIKKIKNWTELAPSLIGSKGLRGVGPFNNLKVVKFASHE
jgi:hypothetical protein